MQAANSVRQWARWMAAESLRIADTMVGEGSMPALIALTLMAQIAYEEGDPDRAGSLLQELMQNSTTSVPVESLVRAYPLLARVHAIRGDLTQAVQQLTEGEKIGQHRGSTRLISACLRECIYWLLAGGQLAVAQECLTRLSRLCSSQTAEIYERGSPINTDHALAEAWVAVACNHSAGLDAMRQLHREALLQGDTYDTVRLGVCLVEVLQTTGYRSEATMLLLELLRTGMGARLCQSFIDGGPGVRALILDMHRNVGDVDEEIRPFLGMMVGRLERCVHVDSQHGSVAQPQEAILSPRETHVLRLIGGGLSNKRIARDLRIAPETVKSHAKHIFAKLGTRTRAESVSRAVKLCIL